MTSLTYAFIPPSIMGTQVASSPLPYPLHPPSQTHPHTPKGCAHALRGNARPNQFFRLVPMPPFRLARGGVGGGYAFALWMLSAEIGRKSSTQNSSDNCSKCSDRSGNQSCFFGEIACVLMCVFCGSAIQFHLRHACTSSSIVGCIGIQKRCFRSQCRLGLSFKFSVQCAQTNNLRRVAVVKKHIFFIVRHSTRPPLTLDLANYIGSLRSYA
jgi:hypothetical protein